MLPIHYVWNQSRKLGLHKWIFTVEGRLTVAHLLHTARAKDRQLPTDNATVDDLRRVLEKQGYRCAYCIERIIFDFELDHKHPIAKGGGHTLDNIQFLCPSCNKSKHAGPGLGVHGQKAEYVQVGGTLKCTTGFRRW